MYVLHYSLYYIPLFVVHTYVLGWGFNDFIYIGSQKQPLGTEKEKMSGSKLGKEYGKAIYYHIAYLTYMQSTSCEMKSGWITSWNQDCLWTTNSLRYADDATLMVESEEELKSLW